MSHTHTANTLKYYINSLTNNGNSSRHTPYIPHTLTHPRVQRLYRSCVDTDEIMTLMCENICIFLNPEVLLHTVNV